MLTKIRVDLSSGERSCAVHAIKNLAGPCGPTWGDEIFGTLWGSHTKVYAATPPAYVTFLRDADQHAVPGREARRSAVRGLTSPRTDQFLVKRPGLEATETDLVETEINLTNRQIALQPEQLRLSCRKLFLAEVSLLH